VGRISKAALPLALLIAVAGYGQSLADVARQNRLKRDKSATVTKKVITTDDISSDAPADPPQPEPYKKMGYSSFTPDMWKRTIEGKKKWIMFLESEKAKFDSQRTVDLKQVTDDPKVRKQLEEQAMQRQYAAQIPEQKKQLLEMCEEARKAGLPPEVWALQ
jgi:hypothetical protein